MSKVELVKMQYLVSNNNGLGFLTMVG